MEDDEPQKFVDVMNGKKMPPPKVQKKIKKEKYVMKLPEWHSTIYYPPNYETMVEYHTKDEKIVVKTAKKISTKNITLDIQNNNLLDQEEEDDDFTANKMLEQLF